MSGRKANCTCGDLSIVAIGDPVKISACHCRSCQHRTGSAFSVAVFYDTDRTTVSGASHIYQRPGDSGQTVAFHFCPRCGSSVYWYAAFRPAWVGIAYGCFGENAPAAPSQAVYEDCRYGWVTIATG